MHQKRLGTTELLYFQEARDLYKLVACSAKLSLPAAERGLSFVILVFLLCLQFKSIFYFNECS